ncbi:unnamed protein product [Closterium sp. NIES-53]
MRHPVCTLLPPTPSHPHPHPPPPPHQVLATIEEQLGSPPSEAFSSFDHQPLATASIAQVHRAVLASGQQVVVKVQHAGIKEKILQVRPCSAPLPCPSQPCCALPSHAVPRAQGTRGIRVPRVGVAWMGLCCVERAAVQGGLGGGVVHGVWGHATMGWDGDSCITGKERGGEERNGRFGS